MVEVVGVVRQILFAARTRTTTRVTIHNIIRVVLILRRYSAVHGSTFSAGLFRVTPWEYSARVAAPCFDINIVGGIQQYLEVRRINALFYVANRTTAVTCLMDYLRGTSTST